METIKLSAENAIEMLESKIAQEVDTKLNEKTQILVNGLKELAKIKSN